MESCHIINPDDIKQAVKDMTFTCPDRAMLRSFYLGNSAEMAAMIFPRPATMDPDEYSVLLRYFSYVNLCKPSVNRIVSGVCSAVSRRVEDGSPYKDKVDEFLSGANGYSLKARTWFKNAVLYGTGIMAFTVRDGEVYPWIPNPLKTRIITGADVHDVQGIIEQIGDGDKATYRFVTAQVWGTADNNGDLTDHVFHGLGICPAVVAYGEDLRAYGEAEGRSLVEPAVQYSAVVSRLLLNLVELVRTYTDPKGVASGAIQNPDEAFTKNGIVEMDANGKFTFASPQTNFGDLSATIDNYKANFCISAGIPLDTLDPSNIPENQSATSARLRNQPLAVTIARLIEDQAINEVQALTIVGALYQWIATAQLVTWNDFKRRFKASVMMLPSGNPESQAEEVLAWQSMLASGAKTTEDLIRHFNRNASEREIQRRIADKTSFAMGEMPIENTQAGETPARDEDKE